MRAGDASSDAYPCGHGCTGPDRNDGPDIDSGSHGYTVACDLHAVGDEHTGSDSQAVTDINTRPDGNASPDGNTATYIYTRADTRIGSRFADT